MRAYTELLVQTCHARGAFAMGGMAALIPSRKDAEANERGDRRRAGGQGARGRAPASTARGSRTPTSCRVAQEEFDDGARRQAQPDRPPARPTSRVTPGRAARRRLHARRDHRGGPAQRRQRRLPVHLVLARRPRRRRDQQPDGGRRHGRDLPLADLAVGPPRQVHRASTCARCSTRRWRRSAPRSATRCGRRAAPTRRGESSSGRARRGLPGVPDPPGLRVPGLSRCGPPSARPGGRAGRSCTPSRVATSSGARACAAVDGAIELRVGEPRAAASCAAATPTARHGCASTASSRSSTPGRGPSRPRRVRQCAATLEAALAGGLGIEPDARLVHVLIHRGSSRARLRRRLARRSEQHLAAALRGLVRAGDGRYSIDSGRPGERARGSGWTATSGVEREVPGGRTPRREWRSR